MRRGSSILLVLTALSMIACDPPKTTASAREPSAMPASEPKTSDSETTTTITITDPSQREAAVGKSVVVIGIQTRTKQPQVNGIDVDGAYGLSDKKVVARGILKKTVVAEPPPAKDGLEVARRGAGTYYAVIDPTTEQIAKTKPAD
jgi:hypothetical protein